MNLLRLIQHRLLLTIRAFFGLPFNFLNPLERTTYPVFNIVSECVLVAVPNVSFNVGYHFVAFFLSSNRDRNNWTQILFDFCFDIPFFKSSVVQKIILLLLDLVRSIEALHFEFYLVSSFFAFAHLIGIISLNSHPYKIKKPHNYKAVEVCQFDD